MERARAAALLASDRPEAEKVAAIETIARAATATRSRCSRRCSPPRRGDPARPRTAGIAAIERRLALWEAGAERLVRPLARLGAAARRHRPRHHLRRDGRHQHGAWRDGDARRLHDLRRAGDDPHLRARAVRLVAADRPAARLPRRRRGRPRRSSAASSASSTAGRSRRCSPPGASRSSCSRRCAPSSARPTARSAIRPGCRAPSSSAA